MNILEAWSPFRQWSAQLFQDCPISFNAIFVQGRRPDQGANLTFTRQARNASRSHQQVIESSIGRDAGHLVTAIAAYNMSSAPSAYAIPTGSILISAGSNTLKFIDISCYEQAPSRPDQTSSISTIITNFAYACELTRGHGNGTAFLRQSGLAGGTVLRQMSHWVYPRSTSGDANRAPISVYIDPLLPFQGLLSANQHWSSLTPNQRSTMIDIPVSVTDPHDQSARTTRNGGQVTLKAFKDLERRTVVRGGLIKGFSGLSKEKWAAEVQAFLPPSLTPLQQADMTAFIGGQGLSPSLADLLEEQLRSACFISADLGDTCDIVVSIIRRDRSQGTVRSSALQQLNLADRGIHSSNVALARRQPLSSRPYRHRVVFGDLAKGVPRARIWRRLLLPLLIQHRASANPRHLVLKNTALTSMLQKMQSLQKSHLARVTSMTPRVKFSQKMSGSATRKAIFLRQKSKSLQAQWRSRFVSQVVRAADLQSHHGPIIFLVGNDFLPSQGRPNRKKKGARLAASLINQVAVHLMANHEQVSLRKVNEYATSQRCPDPDCQVPRPDEEQVLIRSRYELEHYDSRS